MFISGPLQYKVCVVTYPRKDGYSILPLDFQLSDSASGARMEESYVSGELYEIKVKPPQQMPRGVKVSAHFFLSTNKLPDAWFYNLFKRSSSK